MVARAAVLRSDRPLRPGRVVLALILLVLATGAVARAESPPDSAVGSPVEQARAALKSEKYPWYDPVRDAIQTVKLKQIEPIQPSRGPGWNWGNWSWVESLLFVGFAAALIALVVLVARYWKRFEPTEDDRPDREETGPAIGAGEVLPAALRPIAVAGDLWAEADRRRQAGDLAGAIVCLFAHQLLSLSRLGLVRLTPGRTGRQLHRAVADRDFQGLVLPTLRQFEAVYYGHRTPAPADFAVVWESAQAFERRAGEQGKR